MQRSLALGLLLGCLPLPALAVFAHRHPGTVDYAHVQLAVLAPLLVGIAIAARRDSRRLGLGVFIGTLLAAAAALALFVVGIAMWAASNG